MRNRNPDARKTFSLPRTYYGITAVAQFSGRHCTIVFEDPLASETTTLEGRIPLAADYTVPLAVMLADTKPKSLEISRVFFPEKYAATARLARLQPYDPNKTVVLVAHHDRWTRLVLAEALAQAGFHVVAEASNGTAALRMVLDANLDPADFS